MAAENGYSGGKQKTDSMVAENGYGGCLAWRRKTDTVDVLAWQQKNGYSGGKTKKNK